MTAADGLWSEAHYIIAVSIGFIVSGIIGLLLLKSLVPMRSAKAKIVNVPTIESHEVYRTLMAEVKLRLLAAERVTSSATPITGLAALDAELCLLQIRQIIELVTFSALKREEGRYSKLREQDRLSNQRDHGDPSKDWQAPEILKRLVTLSPHALPIPIVRGAPGDSGAIHFERQNIAVNHSRLIELYQKSGGFLHAKNPLAADFVAHVSRERAKYEAAPTEVRRALEFLRKLLWQHAVVQLDWSDPENPKAVGGPASAWLLDFGTTDDQNVTLVLATAAA